jgi:glycosyltransferase involved in cell wall biosynthesis
VIVEITHALGGGVAESILNLRQKLSYGAEFLIMSPTDTAVILECPNPDYAFSLALEADRDYPLLLEVLRRCNPTRLHIHHVHGHKTDLNRLRRDLNVPFDFTAHDYYSICPQFHLTDAAGRFCREPGENGCTQCLAGRPSRPPRSIREWRHEHAWLLRESDRLIAPSHDTARRLVRYIPECAPLVIPHPEPPLPLAAHEARSLSGNEPLRVAILGVLAKHKGLERVRECSRRAQKMKLPLEFILVGCVDTSQTPKVEPFRQTGPYENRSLPDLLTQIKPHLVWFPGEAPETYSFTLSTALRAGLPVVVPNIGALPERVAGLAWKWIIAFDWTPERMNSFFLEIRERNFLPHVPPELCERSNELGIEAGLYESLYL